MAAVARTKWPEAAFYRDYRVMLDEMQSDIDAVIVSTPDHMHAVQTLAAFDLGKHVYCEKPLTHDIAEARRLTEAAARARVVTQMGNQGSSGDSTRLIETWIQEGVIGDVTRVHVWTNRPVWPQGIPTPATTDPIPPELSWNLWLGTAPYRDFNSVYLPATWRGGRDVGTGALGDMGFPMSKYPFVEGGEAGHQQQWVRACKEGYGAYTSSPFDIAGPLTETVLMGNLAIYSHMHRRPEGEGFVYDGRKKLMWDGE